MRLGGVHAHSHPHCVRGNERTLGGDSRRDGISRTLENEKKASPSASTSCPRWASNASRRTAMLRAEVTVRGTVPTRKLRRALDVAKEESHRPARQTSIHTARWYAGCNGRHSDAAVGTALGCARVLSPECLRPFELRC